ncbi:alpha/beta fold hydrolase [Chitinilyticum piscinae]|uniref:Alpha/beta fold hydrolase n=1 Tax=Chitinilyticum piscinae TaxID=2866724 RepID=A0A8J7FLU3_9NEIS|nr:alpha/beta fold hydrolase [Chitinilyticum piscinae]MBE9608639.1 alpha/beta fold hydrolase [Chitinilyticum piscinae]
MSIVRILLRGSGAALLLLVAALLLIAFAYHPAEEAPQIAYLRQLGAQSLTAPHYIFNQVQTGGGSPVLLIHGAGTWLNSFRDTIPALAQQHAVYAFDMPGHGYTQVQQPPERYDLPLMAEAIREYLDQQHLEKVSLVGHSFGGGWALYFAQRYPERVEKLVLLAPRALDTPYKTEWQLMTYPVIGEVFSKLLRQSDVRKGIEEAYSRPEYVSDALVGQTHVPLTFRENRRAQYHLVRDSDWMLTMAAMPSTRSETLIIWGQDDRYLPVAQAATIQQKLPRAQLAVFPGCGHAVHEECAGQVNRLLLDFLAERPGHSAP